MLPKSKFNKSFFVITSLFFIWGFLTVLVDSLIPRLKEIFELSYFEAGFIQFAFFIAYGVVAIPSGELLQKIGYKKGIVRGLTVMGLGCLFFIFAAQERWYLLFLIALFTLAGGMTILQVAANPYVLSLGSKEGAVSRLNISQGFNSLGTTIAPVIGAMYLLGDSLKTHQEISQLNVLAKNNYLEQEIAAIQGPFLILGVVLFAVALVVRFLKLPALKPKFQEHIPAMRLLKNKGLRLGVIGIFLYVGSEVAIGSYLVNYFLDMNLAESIRSNALLNSMSSTLLGTSIEQANSTAIVGTFVAFYWGGAMIGRFIGAYFVRQFRASSVLLVCGVGAISMLLISILSVGFLSMWSILAVGLFNSIMFPTIFALGIEDIETERQAQASGLLCTAIVGGAIIPPLMGFLIDVVDFKYAFLLLVICYAYIAGFGRWKLTRESFKSDTSTLDPGTDLTLDHEGLSTSNSLS